MHIGRGALVPAPRHFRLHVDGVVEGRVRVAVGRNEGPSFRTSHVRRNARRDARLVGRARGEGEDQGRVEHPQPEVDSRRRRTAAGGAEGDGGRRKRARGARVAPRGGRRSRRRSGGSPRRDGIAGAGAAGDRPRHLLHAQHGRVVGAQADAEDRRSADRRGGGRDGAGNLHPLPPAAQADARRGRSPPTAPDDHEPPRGGHGPEHLDARAADEPVREVVLHAGPPVSNERADQLLPVRPILRRRDRERKERGLHDVQEQYRIAEDGPILLRRRPRRRTSSARRILRERGGMRGRGRSRGGNKGALGPTGRGLALRRQAARHHLLPGTGDPAPTPPRREGPREGARRHRGLQPGVRGRRGRTVLREVVVEDGRSARGRIPGGRSEDQRRVDESEASADLRGGCHGHPRRGGVGNVEESRFGCPAEGMFVE
mmetsp:Transcript_56649/g.120288  ORF Transcript_56649/g.120288 Transcript_56649/m.120288 type:complete len:430 (+) Transcript_56649:1248-2537(+)